MHMPVIRKIAAGLAVGWSGFVAAFLYYALLTVLLLGGVSPNGAVVASAYLAPLLAYGVAISARQAGAALKHVRAMAPHGGHLAITRIS